MQLSWQQLWPTYAATALGMFIGRWYTNNAGLTSFWEQTLIVGACVLGAVFLVNFIPAFISEWQKQKRR